MSAANKSAVASANNVIIAENQQRVYDAGHKAAVDRYCPEFTESGAVVTCNPVENYPLKVVSGITPIQAGSGDASPTNVRPITEHANVNLTHLGKNMADITRLLVNGWAIDEDGAYYGSPVRLYDKYHLSRGNFISGCFNPNTQYTVSVEAKQTDNNLPSLALCFGYTDGTNTNVQIKGTEYRLFTLTSTAGKAVSSFYFSYSQAYTTYVKNISICQGTEAPFEPYQGNTFTAQLPQDAYCGNLDWSTGVLTLTHNIKILSGTEAWTKYSTATLYNAGTGFFADSVKGTALYGWCSHAPISGNRIDSSYMKKANSNNGIEVYPQKWGLPDNEVATWNNYLKEQATNGTPVQILYQLNEPITVQLTAQDILSLVGTNTLYCDTGDTTVTFKADPISLVGQLEESIISLGGEI